MIACPNCKGNLTLADVAINAKIVLPSTIRISKGVWHIRKTGDPSLVVEVDPSANIDADTAAKVIVTCPNCDKPVILRDLLDIKQCELCASHDNEPEFCAVIDRTICKKCYGNFIKNLCVGCRYVENCDAHKVNNK